MPAGDSQITDGEGQTTVVAVIWPRGSGSVGSIRERGQRV
jgi:hypothetical protein